MAASSKETYAQSALLSPESNDMLTFPLTLATLLAPSQAVAQPPQKGPAEPRAPVAPAVKAPGAASPAVAAPSSPSNGTSSTGNAAPSTGTSTQSVPSSGWLVIASEGQGNTYDGKAVLAGAEIPAGKILRTGPSGRAKAIHKAGVIVVLTSSSQVLLGNPADPSSSALPQVIEGFTRWIFRKGNPRCARGACRVGTPNAVMGVRGTDFIAIHTPSFRETEVVSFDGPVDFGSRQNEGDFRTVPPGFWGGLGGRYSQQIGPLVRVPAAVVKQFRGNGTIPTSGKAAKPSAEYYGEAVPDGY